MFPEIRQRFTEIKHKLWVFNAKCNFNNNNQIYLALTKGTLLSLIHLFPKSIK